jgi:hypothetical protein
MLLESGSRLDDAVAGGLAQLQVRMLQWLLHEDAAIKPYIADSQQGDTQERLEIYSNAYRFRLIDALADTFPAVHTLMGDELFYQTALAYLDAYPSHHFSLRYFGDGLSHFLHGYVADTPVYAEMAGVEWALRHSFDSADIAPVTLQALQAIPPEQWGEVRFGFHPSVQCQILKWNTCQLWAAIDEGAGPIAPVQQEYPQAWVIWRKELLTYYRSLEVDEAWALDHALQGELFAGLCSGLCEWVDELHAPARLAGFVSRWIGDGLLVAVSHDGITPCKQTTPFHSATLSGK